MPSKVELNLGIVLQNLQNHTDSSDLHHSSHMTAKMVRKKLNHVYYFK